MNSGWIDEIHLDGASFFEFLDPREPLFQTLLPFAHTREDIFEIPYAKLSVFIRLYL
jgi:hypothetical protein